jgi:integrase
MRRPDPDRERIQCRWFVWLVYLRNGIYYADGRGNRPPLGRHSLGSNDRTEAHESLRKLDLKMAVRHGKAPAGEVLDTPVGLQLDEGRTLYLEYASRPPVIGGTRKRTQGCYRRVLNQFQAFAAEKKIETWNRVDRPLLEKYARFLVDHPYASASIRLALTVVKQTMKWLVVEGHLPPSCLVHMKLSRNYESRAYCWSKVEVRAMLDHCRDNPDLRWLGDILLTLAMTGMRISELVQLRWSSVDLTQNMIRLVDESHSRKGANKGSEQTLKGKRGRSFPIHASLQPLLAEMPRHSDGRVFRGPRGGKVRADEVRKKLIEEVLEPLKNRFPTTPGERGFENGRFHSFRHFFCSSSANSGVSERVLMDWLGHTESKMIGMYYHLRDEESRRQMDRLSNPAEGDADDSASEK